MTEKHHLLHQSNSNLQEDLIQSDDKDLELEIGNNPEEIKRAKQVLFIRYLLSTTPRPYISYTILALNIALFILMIFSGVSIAQPKIEDLITWGANYGPLTLNGESWRLISSTFVHAGILHIGLNMWVLHAIGGFVERLVGPFTFFALYIVSALAGSAASILSQPLVVAVGASGAIFGIFGVFTAIIIFKSKEIDKDVLAPFRKSAIFFIVINTIFSFSVPNIDVAAHFGGLFGGFIATLLIVKFINLKTPRPKWTALAVLPLAGVFFLLSFLASDPAGQWDQNIKTLHDIHQKLVQEQKTMKTETESIEALRKYIPKIEKTLDQTKIPKDANTDWKKRANELLNAYRNQLHAFKALIKAEDEKNEGAKTKALQLLKKAQEQFHPSS